MTVWYSLLCSAGVAHLVERHLAKVEVASSSLVARSIKHRSKDRCCFFADSLALTVAPDRLARLVGATIGALLPTVAPNQFPRFTARKLGRCLDFALLCLPQAALRRNPQNRLAASATGGASPISSSPAPSNTGRKTGVFLFCKLFGTHRDILHSGATFFAHGGKRKRMRPHFSLACQRKTVSPAKKRSLLRPCSAALSFGVL